MIGPRTGIEERQAAGERLRAPGANERPADAPGGAASGAAEASRGPGKARDASSRAEGEARKLKQAAQEFESLLLAQILRTAREAGSGGWLGSSESQQMSSTMELAEAQLARAMAQSGALGITRLLAGELPADSAHETGERAPDSAERNAPARLERGRQ
jgi:Rod binding domain-containing protein